MSNHTNLTSSTIESIRILQLNTRRSSAVVHSLLNDPLTSSFHFLLLQEPYFYPHSNLPITHSAWTPFYPDLSNLMPTAGPEDSTVKTLIYVSKKIPTTALAPTPTVSNCITAVRYTASDHTFTLVSAYAPPKQAHKFLPLRQMLNESQLSSTHHALVGMDSNVHHPLWNPPAYSHSHREADNLIQLMAEAGLSLCSQSGIPTFYPPHLDHANTTIDLTWTSPACTDWVTSCTTDVSHTHSHLSDHAAILTHIDLPTPVNCRPKTFRNWKKFDQEKFKAKLDLQLAPVLPVLQHTATDEASLDYQTGLLVQAVTPVMDELVPRTPMHPQSKRWWDKTTLGPLKAAAQQLRRRYQRQRDKDTKDSYLTAAKAFRTAIHDAKREHWRGFLASLTPSTLFTAASYATSEWAAPSLAVPPPSDPIQHPDEPPRGAS